MFSMKTNTLILATVLLLQLFIFFDANAGDDKLKANVAIISEKLDNYKYNFAASANCARRGDHKKTIEEKQFIIKIEDKTRNIILANISSLFEKAEFFPGIESIADRKSYDLIVVPFINDMKIDYDKKTANNRKVDSDSMRGDAFVISLKISLGVQVLQHNMTIIDTFISPLYSKKTEILEGECESLFEGSPLFNGSPFALLTCVAGINKDAEFTRKISLMMEGASENAVIISVDSKPKLQNIANSILEEHALPSAITLSPIFSDDKSFSPNSIIDAGEEAEIGITIANDGKGAGYGTTLKITTDNPKVTHDMDTSLGHIGPGETREVKVKIKAALDLQDGTIPFQITCTEKRGYDCKKYTLNVQSAKLEKPELLITDYKINDSNTGLANGNGNGIPENGETVEIIPLVKNNGVGNAVNVNLTIASINSSIEVKNRSVTIPQIAPGQIASGNLAFYIPPTFADKAIDLRLIATDTRGPAAAETNKQFALNTEINRPVLAYTYKIIDSRGNARSDIQNGDFGEIEIRAANKGQLEARAVVIDLKSDTAAFTKTHDEIARIGSQTEYTPVRFPFQVPRTTEKSSLDVSVKFSQKDFAGITDSINIPVRLVRPELRITQQLLDQNNNDILEQGESADLLVRVENTGQLDADNVVLSMNIDKKGVLVTGNKEVSIGRIEAGKASEPKRFSINVQRIAETGELPVSYKITEQNFGAKSQTLALNIGKEQEEVITVASQERPKMTSPATTVYANGPPVVVISSPRNGDRVAVDSITLQGKAKDDKGIDHLEIRVNGRLLDVGRSVQVKARDNAGDMKTRDFSFDNIALQPGENTILVTAFDNENLSGVETINIKRETKRGEIWAAVIGINQYKDNKLSLKYARNDAESFADYLKTNMGLDRSHVFELYDDKATRRDIMSLLGKRLPQEARMPEDTVYVFFAGHGAPEQDPSAKDEDQIRKYILANDSDPEDLYATAIPMDEIAQIFSKISAERIICIIDSCYSGAGGGRTILAQRGRAVISDDFLNRLSQGKGRIILTSSKPGEVSNESDELKHGYFSYYLLEGLKGKADINSDSVVDIDEISFYLNKIVPEKTSGAQHPVKKGEAEGLVVIGRVK